MASPRKTGGRTPGAKASSKAPSSKAGDQDALDQDAILASLRALAVRLVGRLEGFETGGVPAEDRLLGRGDGLIDGFNALARTIVRIIDKERRIAATKDANPEAAPLDPEELDRRIAAELARIAARRRAAAGDAQDGAGSGAQGIPE
jgi:hypothetical protein